MPTPSLSVLLCVKLMKPNCLNYVDFLRSSLTKFDHHLAKIPYRVCLTITYLFCISVLFLLYTAWFNISLLNCVTSYHILCAERKQINCYTENQTNMPNRNLEVEGCKQV